MGNWYENALQELLRKMDRVMTASEAAAASLAASGSTPATTGAFARQTTGSVDYANALRLGISVTCVSGTVTFMGATLDVGASVGFTAEPGGLLSGALVVNCGSGAGIAHVVTTLRS